MPPSDHCPSRDGRQQWSRAGRRRDVLRRLHLDPRVLEYVGQWRSTRCAHLCVLGYLTEINLRQRSLQVGAPHSARAALEPLRVVTIAVPGVPAPLRTYTRPTPEAVAVALALGCTLPSRLPLPPQPDPAPPPHVEVVT